MWLCGLCNTGKQFMLLNFFFFRKNPICDYIYSKEIENPPTSQLIIV